MKCLINDENTSVPILNLQITSTVFHPCLNFPGSISMGFKKLWFLMNLNARAYFQYIHKMTVCHRSILISVLKEFPDSYFRPNASTVETSCFTSLRWQWSPFSSKSCFYLGFTVFLIKVHGKMIFISLEHGQNVLKTPCRKTTGKGKNHCGVFSSLTAVSLREMSLMRDAN